ncbi:MAG: hypothetical protein ACP5RW_08245 [bacterium]
MSVFVRNGGWFIRNDTSHIVKNKLLKQENEELKKRLELLEKIVLEGKKEEG